jgi:hypothetical protein
MKSDDKLIRVKLHRDFERKKWQSRLSSPISDGAVYVGSTWQVAIRPCTRPAKKQVQAPNPKSNLERSLKGWKVATYSWGKVATKKHARNQPKTKPPKNRRKPNQRMPQKPCLK